MINDKHRLRDSKALRMTILCEPLFCMHRGGHLNFNRALLDLWRRYSSDSIIWAGDQRYGEALLGKTRSTDPRSINYRPKYTLPEAIRRYLHIFNAIARHKQARNVVFLSMENTFFPLLCLLYYKHLTNRNLICIIHNNIETLTKSSLKRMLFRFVTSRLSIRYVVLTKTMQRYADQLLNTKTILLRHPFPRGLHQNNVRTRRSFITLGRQAVIFFKMGFLDAFLTACEQQLQINSESIQLTIALQGFIPLDKHIHPSLQITQIAAFIPGDQYATVVGEADFFIFPYDAGSKYRASGTLLDALTYGTIFIAPNVGHFREFKGCGILYERGQFEQAIHKALNCTEAQKEEFRRNMIEKRKEIESANNEVLREIVQTIQE